MKQKASAVCAMLAMDLWMGCAMNAKEQRTNGAMVKDHALMDQLIVLWP